jgi:N-acetylglucosaminyldiphosphoundecaprenol N-acetyl-beta-D-mannosaminyltransferase
MAAHTADSLEWQQRWRDLVKGIVRVRSEGGQEQLIESLVQPGEPRIVAFVNAHAMNAAAISGKFFSSLMSADLLLRDGTGMAILMRLLNQPAGLNLNGTDLIPRILDRFHGETIAFFGTQDPYLARARVAVAPRLGPAGKCVTAHGFLETVSYLRLAAAHRPAVIVLGMGMPRQEEVALVLRAALGYPCLIICGGAIIDFLGSRVARAPLWMRNAGLEWLFRLALEPRRLFRRYVLGNPLFIARALILAARSLRHERGAAA